MRRRWLYVLPLIVAGSTGCGTTKWSDSPRTATEQLLVSDAVDRAISAIDFSALNDKSVYLDTRFIETTLDHNYVVSTLRQHMLASGCIIMDKPEESDFVVEVRTGSLGTNRNDVLVGMPATQLPSMGLMPTAAAIPEIALSKRTQPAGRVQDCRVCLRSDVWPACLAIGQSQGGQFGQGHVAVWNGSVSARQYL